MNASFDFSKAVRKWANENKVDAVSLGDLNEIIRNYSGLKIIDKCRETIKAQRNMLKLHNIRMD